MEAEYFFNKGKEFAQGYSRDLYGFVMECYMAGVSGALEWNETSKKLPKEGVMVLVKTNNRYLRIAERHEDFWYGIFNKDEKPTAWRYIE